VKDRRTIAMIAMLVLVGAAGALYFFAGRGDAPGGEGGGGSVGGAGAGLILLLLVAASAGASRRKRVLRDREELDSREGDR
jgi:hypothetical protein